MTYVIPKVSYMDLDMNVSKQWMYEKWQTSFNKNMSLVSSPNDKDSESVPGLVDNSARALHWHPHAFGMAVFPMP